MGNPEKIFIINYQDLNEDAKSRYDEFVRECGGTEEDVINERETFQLAQISEYDLDLNHEEEIQQDIYRYGIEKYIDELEEKKRTVGLTADEEESLCEYKGRVISMDAERDFLNGEGY